MMHIDYEAVLGVIAGEIEELLTPAGADAPALPVMIGPLPPTEGVGVTMASGTVRRDLAGNAMAVIRLGVNVKLASQQDAVSLMSGIHGEIADLTGAAEDGSWQITGCSVLATPAAVRQDSDGHWLCTSTVQVRATFYLEE